MKNKKESIQNKSEVEKVLEKLTGQVGVDKEMLISSIHRLRENGADADDVALLGVTLYNILLENGLNESDVINPDRLLNKIDAFVYEGKFEKALELLEVIDAVEIYAHPKNLSKTVYYTSTILEAEIIFKKNLKTKKEEGYILSRRPYYLNLKAEIYLQMGRKQDAEKAVAEALKLNPCNFDSLMLKAEMLKDKNLEKYKKALYECYEVAYTKAHMIEFYFHLAEYYEKKKNFYGAYLTLTNILQYDDESLISHELDRLEVEMNKTALSRFTKPTKHEISNFCQTEGIPKTLPRENLFVLVLLEKDKTLDEEERVVLKKILKELNSKI